MIMVFLPHVDPDMFDLFVFLAIPSLLYLTFYSDLTYLK